MEELLKLCEDLTDLEGQTKAGVEQARMELVRYQSRLDTFSQNSTQKFAEIRGRLSNLILKMSSPDTGSAKSQRSTQRSRNQQSSQSSAHAAKHHSGVGNVSSSSTLSHRDVSMRSDAYLADDSMMNESIPSVCTIEPNQNEAEDKSAKHVSAITWAEHWETTAEFNKIDEYIEPEDSQEKDDGAKKGRSGSSSKKSSSVSEESPPRTIRSTRRWDVFSTQV